MIVSRKDTPQEVKPEEVRDEALKNYRELVLNRPKKNFQLPAFHSLVYGSGLLVVIAIIVVGISMFNNYEKMKKLETAVSVMEQKMIHQEQTLHWIRKPRQSWSSRTLRDR